MTSKLYKVFCLLKNCPSFYSLIKYYNQCLVNAFEKPHDFTNTLHSIIWQVILELDNFVKEFLSFTPKTDKNS